MYHEAHFIASSRDIERCRINLSTGIDVSVYMTFDTFVRDIWNSFDHDAARARYQCAMDAPRIVLVVDGVVHTKCPDESVPAHLLPLCTQAIMGMAVELLHFSSVQVAERATKAPLVIHLSNDSESLFAYKGLRTLPADEAVEITLYKTCDGMMCIHYLVAAAEDEGA